MLELAGELMIETIRTISYNLVACPLSCTSYNTPKYDFNQETIRTRIHVEDALCNF